MFLFSTPSSPPQSSPYQCDVPQVLPPRDYYSHRVSIWRWRQSGHQPGCYADSPPASGLQWHPLPFCERRSWINCLPLLILTSLLVSGYVMNTLSLIMNRPPVWPRGSQLTQMSTFIIQVSDRLSCSGLLIATAANLDLTEVHFPPSRLQPESDGCHEP